MGDVVRMHEWQRRRIVATAHRAALTFWLQGDVAAAMECATYCLRYEPGHADAATILAWAATRDLRALPPGPRSWERPWWKLEPRPRNR